MNKISNVVSNISNMDDYLTNLAKQANSKNKTKITSKNTYFKYNIDKCLKTDFHNIKATKGMHINFCCFRIVESSKYSQVLYPYLQYLLYKYPTSKKKENDLCLFPFIEFKSDMKILDEGKKMVKNIFNKQYNCLGYLIQDKEVFLFYNIDTFKEKKVLLSKKDTFWWCLIDEICNHRKILNFPIHKTTTSLFLKNPNLIYLKNKQKQNIEIPIVVYRGDYFDFMPYLFIIGQKSTTSAPLGPFYYFTNFLGAFRRAVWSTNYKMVKVNHKLITDENGKFKKSGIIRYLVFLNKTKVILNNKNDILKKELVKDMENIKTWGQRKNIGKWSKKNDSLFLNKIKINNSDYYNQNPIIVVKNLENIRALSIHEVDMKTVKPNWDPLYTKYDIL